LRLRLKKSKCVWHGLGLLVLIFSLFVADASAQSTPQSPVPLPVPFNPIVDNANVIDAATRQKLESIYRGLKERANIEYAVVTVDTTGALLYLNLLRIAPDAAFSINWTAYTIFIVVIGGLGTVEGPIVGTLLFFLLREALSDFGAWYMILLGMLAVVTMLRFPQGLWGLLTERWDVHVFPLQRRVRIRE